MTSVRRAVLRARFLPIGPARGGLREYRPGEEARTIDWPASAQRGSLQLRERERDATITWGAVIDRSLSMNAGRRRSLSRAAAEAEAFWRACAAPADRWIEIDPAAVYGCSRALYEAVRTLPAHSALLVASDFHDLPEVPRDLLRAAARRMHCTAIVARDPWRDDLPPAGFVVIADMETGATRRFFIGPRERSRFRAAAHARERATLSLLRAAGWRAASFTEEDGASAVLHAFDAA